MSDLSLPEYASLGRLQHTVMFDDGYPVKRFVTEFRSQIEQKVERGVNKRPALYFKTASFLEVCRAKGKEVIPTKSTLSDAEFKILSEKLGTERRLSIRHRLVLALLSAAPISRDPGVYILIKGEEVVYIGQSFDVLCRIGGHMRKPFDRAVMIRVDDAEARRTLERELIVVCAPRFNLAGVPR